MAAYKLDETATDAASKKSEAVDQLAQSEASRPKDHELLKAILGDDYATQGLTDNNVYEQEDFTNLNNDELLTTEAGETDIDKSLGIILHEDDELPDNLEAESLNAKSTDIDVFLQKYLTDDDMDDASLLQHQPADETSEYRHENNIEELIQTILNEDTVSENLPDENSLLHPGLGKTVQSARTSQIAGSKATDQPSKNRLAVVQNRTKIPGGNQNKIENTHKPKPSTTISRVPAISFILLIFSAGLAWFIVTALQEEPTRHTEIKSNHVAEIKTSSAPKKESDSAQDQPASHREPIILSSSHHTEPPTEPENKALAMIQPAPIKKTVIQLVEQENNSDKDKSTEEPLTVESENETHETRIKTTIIDTTDVTHNKISDGINSTTSGLTNKSTPPDEVQENPVVTKNGDVYWALNLSSVHKQNNPATRELERIRSAGIPAEIKAVYVNKKKWHRIRVTGFSSYIEAKDFIAEVREKTDLEDYWISKEIDYSD